MKRRLTRAELITRSPVWQALAARPVEAQAQLDLNIAGLSALDDILHGRGNWHHLDTLACAANVALILCERGYGPEHTDQVVAAQLGVMRAQHRAAGARSIGFDGPAVVALRAALEILEQQMALAERREVVDALNTVNARIAAGRTFKETA